MTARRGARDDATAAEADIVIVGGGSAGAVLARRLADARIGTVLLIEAGGPDAGDPTLMDIRRLGEQRASLDWGYRAARLPGGPPDLRYGRARCLGGCGNHNDCAWLVPPDDDFARWEAAGAAGWSPDAMRPAFARVHETVAVAPRPPDHPVTSALLAAAAELGHPPVDALRRIAPGAGMMPLNATGRQRNSASVSYLHPLDRLPRTLRLMTDTQVTGIAFDRSGRRVIGCRTDRGVVLARREVVLAAGAIGSPVLLMLAGIGDPAALAAAGIDPRVRRPGVGRNLCDHASASVVFELADTVPDWAVTPYESVLFLGIGAAPPAVDVLVHLGLTAGSAQGRDNSQASGGIAGPGRLIDLAPNVMRPASRGRVTIASPDPRDPPAIDLAYFSDAEGSDIRLVREALRRCSRFGAAGALARLGARELRPGPAAAADETLDAYVRETCETVYHACGTCRIGAADDPGAVVGPDLRVHGVEGLRVCDASVFPDIVGVNIHSTVLAVAERGSALIAADLRAVAPGASAAAATGRGGEAKREPA